MSIYDSLRATREGGSVVRGHTIPQIGYRYTVGQHSYDVVSILLLLHPEPSMRLIRAALWHDVPERWVGDVPAPVKWNNPIIQEQLAREEKRVSDHFGLDSEHDLNPEDKSWLKGADMLDLRMWCHDQIALGNTEVIGTLRQLEQAMVRMESTLPKPIVDAWYEHRVDRLPEVLETNDE
jgi:5'-deoxynucleotidase YfbR-like HD superfamily hydrolase